MKHLKVWFSLAAVLFFITACQKDEPTAPCDETNQLKLNQLQIIASHNSYRLRTYAPLYEKIWSLGPLLPPEFDPSGFDYEHLPLPQQFDDYGVRGIELDIYLDPNGGLFYNRMANLIIPEPIESGIPELLAPGIKILHVSDLDYMTNYLTFKAALQTLKTWSEAHPNHLPIFVNVETKTDGLLDYLDVTGAADPLPFTPDAADDMDEEVRAVFGNDLLGVITPDKVRQTYPTLREAVVAGNWPTLAEARGKVVFIIDGNSDFYTENHPSYQGRVMFAYENADQPEAAFIIANDAIGSQSNIRQWVGQGFIVRTRTDSDTYEARIGDYSKMNAAFASGAQIISTDYYKPDPRYLTDTAWTDFTVRFPNNELARINAVSADSIYYQGCVLTE